MRQPLLVCAAVVTGLWMLTMTVAMMLLIFGEAAIVAQYAELRHWFG